jgi:mannan endo-1,4-beta-mannosidase
MNISNPRLGLGLLLVVFGFSAPLLGQTLIDKKATPETLALYTNLKKLSQQNLLFGHQDTDAYGTTWKAVSGKSDVKDVAGSYPAVHGWDVAKLGLSAANLDSVNFEKMLGWINATYERGGINTISWHLDNPANKKSAWDTVKAVRHILPGGKAHADYVKELDVLAGFLNRCSSDATKIPIIFRPFHEHNGNWFWWGKGNCTEQEYVQLWKFTIDYLKNKKNLHHLIYAFSPDRSRINLDDAKTSYLYAYPGDDYVDIIGLDNYMDVGVQWNRKSREEQNADLVKILRTVSTLAIEKNKVAALTETGQEGVTNAAWFTEVILHPLKTNPDIKLAYVMVWRNANVKHHYAPYTGHPAAADLVKFYNDPYTLFESDLRNIYKSNKPLTK